MHDWLTLQDDFPILELTFGNLAGVFGRVQRAKLHDQTTRVQQLLTENADLHREYTVKLAASKAAVTGVETRHSVEQANTQAAELLARLEMRLQSDAYIAGERYSLADIAWTTMLERFRFLKMDHFWKNRPAVVAYEERLRARPSFRPAIAAFIRPSVILKMVLSALAVGFRSKLSSSS